MTSKQDRLGGFEERLLVELKSVVAQRGAEQPARQPTRAPLWRRSRIVSLASAGALAIGAAVGVPLIGGGTTAPASAGFTVESEADGSVHVEVDFAEFDDPAALQQSLDEHGVPAVVVTRDSSADADPVACAQYTPWAEGQIVGPNSPVEYVNHETFRRSAFVLHPDLVPDDGTIVLAFYDDSHASIDVFMAIGDPPTC